MLKRIVTSIVALGIFVPILFFSDHWIFPIAMSFAATVGVWEMLDCLKLKNKYFLTVPLCLLATFFPLFIRFTSTSDQLNISDFIKLAIGLSFITALYIFCVAVFDNKNIDVADVGLLFASCFYIISAFTSIVYIYDYIAQGKYIYLLAFLCAWITDIFAYFTGKFFGKHKLLPSVSPKKTIEGAIGGVLFCIISLIACGFIIETWFNPEGKIQANYIVLAVSGIFISVVSQIGDLIMSLIKRRYGIKDYGIIFPGHGGILDRFDSVIAVSLILAFISTYFNLFAIS